MLLRVDINACHDFNLRIFFTQLTDHMTHMSVASIHNYFCHNLSSSVTFLFNNTPAHHAGAIVFLVFYFIIPYLIIS